MKISTKTLLIVGLTLVVGLLLGYLLFRPASAVTDEEVHVHETEETQMWTCSMHPQIMQPEPGDCPICGMDLIPAEAGAEGLSSEQFKLTENAMALANIRTQKVGSGDQESTSLQLSGKIMENEKANAVQASYFKGRIEHLSVNSTGEQVRQGQVLASIYAPELVAAQQELLTAANMKEKQPRLYQAVREKMKRWKLSETQIDQIEVSGEVRQNFPVLATVSGTVTEKLVQEGDYVNQGQPLFRIANLNTVWAVFDAYEQDLPYLEKGQDVEISANAYPSREFAGEISFIEPILNTASRTVKIRVPLENNNGLLKPGMFVTGSIDTGRETESTLSVPATAVMWTGERSIVYVQPDPSQPVFEMREVAVGPDQQGMRTILSGLEGGEHVVVNGTFTVDAAAQLQNKPSMMNQDQDTSPVAVEGIDQGLKEQLRTALPHYFGLKDALIAGNQEEAAQAAEQVYETIGKDNSDQKELSISLEMLEAIIENKTLENQRDHFVILNENLIPLYKGLSLAGSDIFIQHCPMANNNQGAIWLSSEEEVRNPYYGDAMLSCGSVIATIGK